jgi:predicted regulator of Ras-like GTPase activity (Roadblock/LC7/MglB family)/type II secretory pathway predicted ATPase ExeA
VDFYDNPAYAYAWSILVAKISQRSGPLVVTGESGIGKSLLVQRVVRSVGEEVRPVLLSFPRLGVDDTLHFLAGALGLSTSEYRADNGPEERFEALRNWLGRERGSGRYVTLFIDDAQDVADDALVSLLRLSRRDEGSDEAALGLVLVGLPQLELKLMQRQLRELVYDKLFFCRLRPLRPGEVGAYIRKRLTGTGNWHDRLLTPEAVARIGAYAHGIPRLINTLCDTALFTADRNELDTITAETVEEAATLCTLPLGLGGDRLTGLGRRGAFPACFGNPHPAPEPGQQTADASGADRILSAYETEAILESVDIASTTHTEIPTEAEDPDDTDHGKPAAVPAQDTTDGRLPASTPSPVAITPRGSDANVEPQDLPDTAAWSPGSAAGARRVPTTKSSSQREKPMYRTESLNKVLKSIQTGSPDVEASALITEDGLMIASALPQDLDETRVAGMSATLLSLGTRAAAELGRGNVEEVVVRGEQGYAVMITAGRGVLLLVVANENAKLGLIFFDMREAINAIKRIL